MEQISTYTILNTGTLKDAPHLSNRYVAISTCCELKREATCEFGLAYVLRKGIKDDIGITNGIIEYKSGDMIVLCSRDFISMPIHTFSIAHRHVKRDDVGFYLVKNPIIMGIKPWTNKIVIYSKTMLLIA